MSLRPRLLALLLCVPGLALAVDPIRPPQPLNAPPKQAIETASGMSYIVLKPAPDANRFFSGEWVEYRADVWSSDGVTRASSRESGPVVATVRRLAAEQPGLARAILSSPVGETRRWWIQPERLLPGYPGMPNLLHVVDLTVVGEKNPVQVPADVAAPPADDRSRQRDQSRQRRLPVAGVRRQQGCQHAGDDGLRRRTWPFPHTPRRWNGSGTTPTW